MAKEKYVYLGLFALGGIFFLTLATYPFGIGVTPDSVNYLTAAKNLIEGQGLSTDVVRWYSPTDTVPLTRWPPFYSIAVAVLYKLGFSLLNSAWLLNLILFGLNAFLIGGVLLNVSGSFVLSASGVLLFFIVNPSHVIHSLAWTEPLFLCLLMLTFILLIHYLKTRGFVWLVLAGVAAGFGWLTRFIGLVIIITVVIVLLLPDKKTIRERFVSALLFGITAAVPFVFWSYRAISVFGELPGRSGYMTGKGLNILAKNVWLVFPTIAHWFFPYLPEIIAVFVFLVIALGIFWPLLRKTESRENIRGFFLRVWLIFIPVYTIFLMAICYYQEIVFLKNYNNNRYLYVILPPLLISLMLAFHAGRDWWDKKVPSRYTMFVFLVLCLPLLVNAASWGGEIFQGGVAGYTDKNWRDNECISWLNEYELERVLFSQGNDALAILTNYRVRDLPWGKEKNNLAAFYEVVQRVNGLVICLDNYVERAHYLTESELLATGKFIPVATFSDGRIYKLKD